MRPDLQPIVERKEELERVIYDLTERIAGAPEGHLIISKSGNGGTVKYYQSVYAEQDGRRNERRSYIAKKDAAKARALAEKGYYEAVLRSVKRERDIIEQFLKRFPAESGESVYAKLGSDRKALVEPYWESNEAFVNRWLREEYPRKAFREGDPYYVTARGERVRSKSELIIADWLYHHGIPYRYECPLKLWDPTRFREITVYPDFTILDPVTGKCFYLEHLGMMGDEAYYRSAMERIALYEANGYFEGETLILSYESDKVPLDMRQLGRKLDHYLRRDT